MLHIYLSYNGQILNHTTSHTTLLPFLHHTSKYPSSVVFWSILHLSQRVTTPKPHDWDRCSWHTRMSWTRAEKGWKNCRGR